MSPTPRVNLYQGIHKAIRAQMCHTLLQVGRTDPGDADERAASGASVDALLTMCRQHLHHENEFIHAAMERRCPGSASPLSHEHEEHIEHIAHLRSLAQHALQADAPTQDTAWQDLYLALSLFVAENFSHMVREERDHNAVLWQHYSDAELVDIHHALVASIPPEEMAQVMPWMIPQLSPPERAGLFSEMQQGMPPEVFAMQLTQTQALLDAPHWRKLQQALNLAPHALREAA